MAQATQKPTKLNIERKRGDTVPMKFSLRDAQNNAVDITGFTFKLTLDPSSQPTNASRNLFQLTGTITDATGGLFEFPYTTTQANVAPGEYYYDVELIDGDSKIRTVSEGKYTITQDVTK